MIFRANDPASGMYYIQSGEIELPELGKVLGAGQIIGEMGVFSPSGVRSASAVCKEDLVAYYMDRDGVLKMMDSSPRDVLQLISLAVARFAENLQRETAERERLASELRIAAQIQTSFLPKVFPKRHDVDLFAVMNPAREVGGDFYDFFMLDERTLFFAIGDVSGKGVPAALFMMTVKTYLHTLARRGTSPPRILEQVNRLIHPENSSMMFVTLQCGVMNLRTGEVHIGNSGHNPPLAGQDVSTLDYLPLEGSSVIGILPDIAASEVRVVLGKGGIILVYTDGITEASNRDKEFYSDERLVASARTQAASSMQMFVEGISTDVAKFVGSAPRFDDIAMLAIKYRGPALTKLADITLPARSDSLDRFHAVVSNAARDVGLDETQIADIDVATEEVLANVIHHAYPEAGGDLRAVCYRGADGSLVVEFSDHGIPFDVSAVEAPEMSGSVEDREVGGLGILLIRSLTDNLQYLRDGDLNVLTLTVHCERAGGPAEN